MAKKAIPENVAAYIEEAIRKAMESMLAANIQNAENPYKSTIHRLEAITILQEKVQEDKRKLAGMKEDGCVQGKSKSIVRFSAGGTRVDPEEMYETVCSYLEAHIAADTEEIETMLKAMDSIESDYYFNTVYERFMFGTTDEEIAEMLHCDTSTVRRNRSRLVRIISIRLYGVMAL